MRKHKTSVSKPIVSVVLVAGIMAIIFALSIPEDQMQLGDPRLIKIASSLGVSEQKILDDAKEQLIINNFVGDDLFVFADYGFTIDEIEYSFDEIELVDVVVKPLSLTRTFTFDDGSTDVELIDSSTLDAVSLDFLAISNDVRPLTNGKVKFQLEIPVSKDIDLLHGEFTVGLNDKVIKSIFVDKTSISSSTTESDVTLLLFSEEFNIKQILSNLPDGDHTLEIRLDELYVIHDDNSREYSNPLEILYSVSLEKNSAKTIKKNEQGFFTKVFDFDVPITISANTQSTSVSVCLSGCRGGGCCQTYSESGTIPAPALGAVTITDVSTGEIVASKDAGGAGYCSSGFGRAVLSGGLTQCRTTAGGGGSLGFSAQRGESYLVTVSDPSASWTIDVPEDGGAFNYSCVDSKSRTQTGTSWGNYGTSRPIYSISSERVCGFP